MQNKIKIIGKNFTEDAALQMLDHLRTLAGRLGHTPTCIEVNEDGNYNHYMYLSCFGSMRKAQQMAGLKPNRPKLFSERKVFSSTLVTKRMCLADLKRIESLLGCYPSYYQIKEYAKYPFSVYLKYLGGMKWMRTLPPSPLQSA